MKARILPAALALLLLGFAAASGGAEEGAEDEGLFVRLARLAQARDARLAAEQHTLQALRENVRIGEAALYPRVQFSSRASSARQRLRGRGDAGSDTLEHSLSAGMELFNVQSRLDARAVASEALAQTHRRSDVAQEVLLDVIAALLEMHAAAETRQLLHKRRRGMAQRLELARARAEEGVAPRLEIIIAEAEMEAVKAELALGEARLRKARQTLHNLTGTAIIGLPPLRAGFRLPPLPPAEAMAREALRGNPELKRAEEMLQSRMHRTAAAAANRLPVLALGSEYSLSSSGTESSGIAISLTIPLYAGGALPAGAAMAAEQQRAAAAAIRDYRRRLSLNVSVLHQDAQAIVQREQALKAQAAARTQLLEKTRLAWLEGLRSAQDVIDVEQTLFENERDLRTLHFQYLGILAQLQRLQGGISSEFLAQLDSHFQ